MAEAGLSLGSNLGDRAGAILAALRLLDRHAGIKVTARSRLYETAPWGDANQDPFLNACALVETSLNPHDLLDLCLDVEKQLGRDRAKSRRWGPREIDIDVLFYDRIELSGATLTLPHPHLFDRAFVLVPLGDIAPTRTIGNRVVGDAANAIDKTGIAAWDQAEK
jgi:2-amino-4-hydroxy-6-hydroxymethyldihydropteridine diphosphokinase